MNRRDREGKTNTTLHTFLLCAALAGAVARAEPAPVPADTAPPLPVAPGLVPQFVLLTFDDSVTTASFERVRRVLNGRSNPNGQPVKATFFVSLDANYDPASIRRLYEDGHEIAVHTLSHQTGSSTGLTRWRQEIAGAKHTLSRLCAIPDEDIVGFRAPFLDPNDDAFRVLEERGFLYDSSFPAYVSGLSTSTTNMIWPYTLHAGLAQSAPPARAPARGYPGLFEIPLWAHYNHGTLVTTMDPPEALSASEVSALWMTNFLAHYHGNRAPYGLFLHATSANHWLAKPGHEEWRGHALGAFIDWALAQPDVWFVTCRDLADYMRDPVAVADIAAQPPFQTPARLPFPTAELVRCSFPDAHPFYACGVLPLAAPTYSNAFLGAVPFEGGAAAVNVVSQDTDYAWCVLTVTNDTERRLYDWAVRFDLAGGALQSLYDARWTQQGEEVRAEAKPYNRQLAPGAALAATFRVRRDGGEVVIGPVSLTATGLGPQSAQAHLERASGAHAWRLSWSECALLYHVEATDSLVAPQVWVTVSNGLGLTEIELPHAGATRFFRVSGTLE